MRHEKGTGPGGASNHGRQVPNTGTQHPLAAYGSRINPLPPIAASAPNGFRPAAGLAAIAAAAVAAPAAAGLSAKMKSNAETREEAREVKT